jgi:hypothetical protein
MPVKRKKRPGEEVCRCDAYKFPHREGSGYCEQPKAEEPYYSGQSDESRMWHQDHASRVADFRREYR